MNAILSLVLCVAMLFSGAYCADSGEAKSARSVVVENVTVDLNGNQHFLSPSLKLSCETEGETARVVGALAMEENTLFPVELDADAEGLKLLFCDTERAYHIAPELLEKLGADFEEEEIALLTEIVRFMGRYDKAFLESMRTPPSKETLLTAQKKLLGDAVGSIKESYSLEGEERSGYPVTRTLENEEAFAFLDTCYQTLYPDLYEEVQNIGNLVARLRGDETTQQQGLEAFLQEVGLAIEINGHVDADAAEIGEYSLLFRITVDEETREIPVSYAFMGDEGLVISCSDTMPDGGSLAYRTEIREEYTNVTLNMTDENGTAMEFFWNEDRSAELSGILTASVLTDGDQYIFNSNYGATEAYVVCSVQIEDLEKSVYPTSYELSFNLSYGESPTEPLLGDQEMTEVTEDTLNQTAMQLTEAALRDWQTLLKEPSVAAFAEAVSEAISNGVQPDEEGEEFEDAEQDLSFALPRFDYIPEGYTLEEPTIYGMDGDDYVSYSLDYQGEESKTAYMIDLSRNGPVKGSRYLLSDLETPLTEPVVQIAETQDGVTARLLYDNGIEVMINAYGDAVAVPEILAIINGIQW